MSFLIEDEELSRRYDDIWNKVSTRMKKELDSELLYNKEFVNKEMSILGSYYTSLAVISIDFTFKKDENYYPQVFLKQFKYIK